MEFDLVVRAGRVFCPASGFDGPGAVAVSTGRIAMVQASLKCSAQKSFDFPDGLLLPGLVDFHAHPALGASKYGIHPDRYMLPTGVTTVLSQGDAGPWTWPAYRIDVVQGCKTRVKMALNLAGPGEARPLGCFTDPQEIDVAGCIATLRQKDEALWGLSINPSRFACGETDPKKVVRQGLEVASATGKPILYGPRQTADWPLAEQLAQLRPGDFVTYCFDPNRNVLGTDRKVLPAVREAQARGVLFDVGPGVGAFDVEAARAALDQGFAPDTISSDLYGGHLGRLPQHDLPRVLSNMIALGMDEKQAFGAVTRRPAEILGLANDVGRLTAGACADLVVLRKDPGDGTYRAILSVRAGEVVTPMGSEPLR